MRARKAAYLERHPLMRTHSETMTGDLGGCCCLEGVRERV